MPSSLTGSGPHYFDGKQSRGRCVWCNKPRKEIEDFGIELSDENLRKIKEELGC